MSLVSKAFESSKIVPDVIPTPPSGNIELKYPSGAVASQGNELTPTQVKEQPSVSYEADPNAFYTLVFTDPDNYDGPEPVYREWHHWLVGNIPGSDVSKGEVLSGYIGSGPPEGTGIHRYVYILYKQPGKLNFDEKRLTNKSIDGRAAFSTKKFAEKYSLGAPVAGNFYRAQFDDYVPLLYKSLGVRHKMHRLCVLILLGCVSNLTASPVQSDVAQTFLEHEVVPDVLSVAPAEYLTVKFPSGAEVNGGNVLTPTLVKDVPTLSWNANPDLFYTVVNTDPDAPSRADPVSREFAHWLVGNVPGDDIAAGDRLMQYVGAGPSLGSGLHRYVFLVYQQPAKLEFDEPRIDMTAENRRAFSIANFAKKYNLGDPIAGNFYQAEYDDYVPTVHEQLGI
uniref:SFRICE_002482 n=1 Tax=Spodoptera frugiperda TaxID=7108 RepID=A0A2H1X2U3_SPOFR